MKALLEDTAARAGRYRAAVGGMRVAPRPARLEEFGGPLPDGPSDPGATLALPDDVGSPATVAASGGRYSGLVIGGAVPAATAAHWLAGIWYRCHRLPPRWRKWCRPGLASCWVFPAPPARALRPGRPGQFFSLGSGPNRVVAARRVRGGGRGGSRHGVEGAGDAGTGPARAGGGSVGACRWRVRALGGGIAPLCAVGGRQRLGRFVGD